MNLMTPLSQITSDTKHQLRNKLLGLAEYQERQDLNLELNADAYELLAAPVQLSHLVLMSDRQHVDQERALIVQLCERYGVMPPSIHNSHFSAELGAFLLRWERHTEYSTYTFYHVGPFEVPFTQPAIRLVPEEWLASLPGEI